MIRKLLCMFILGLFLTIPFAGWAEQVQPFAGSWQTITGDVNVHLTVTDEGKVQLLLDEESIEDVLQAGSTSFADGAYTLSFSGDFLILQRKEGAIFVLVRDLYALPAAQKVTDLALLNGDWQSDYAIVSGFRVPLSEETRMEMQLQDGEAILSWPGANVQVQMAVELADDGLLIPLHEQGTSLFLIYREDGSMTRDVDGMIFHYVRTDEQ